MMFSLAGIISFKMMPQDRKKRYLVGKLGKNGISCKLVGALEMALLFALFESFLAGTSNHSFIWVYRWWGVLPVFITTYIPFFLASNYVPDMEPRKAAPEKNSGFACFSCETTTSIFTMPL